MTLTPALRDLYAQRRLHLAQQLGPGGIALVPTAPSYARNRDSEFPYRHDSYFYDLCGFTEPDAWLLITADGETTLLCQPKDLEREIWDGYRLGPDAAPAALGVQQAWSSQDIEQRLPRLVVNRHTVWYPFAPHQGFPQR
ncbi:MAG: aminopeptidase P N-terminal domain-containing protein, partial [Burkholderiaceae bacterium]